MIFQSEVDGCEAIARLAVYHSQVVGSDLERVVRLLMLEFKNPRSQVTRAALQTATILFTQLGQCVKSKLKVLKKTIFLLYVIRCQSQLAEIP